MTQNIHFKIATPERVVYDSDITEVSIPTQDGEITVLPGHIPLVSILKGGELRFKKDGQELAMAVSGGFVEVRSGSNVVVLADTAERAEEIDIERAEAARKHAEELLKKQDFVNDVEFATIQAALERSLSRIKVSRRRGRR